LGDSDLKIESPTVPSSDDKLYFSKGGSRVGDGIGFGGREQSTATAPTSRLIPMQVGSATVYVEQFGAPPEVEVDDRIRAVAPDPKKTFEQASEILRECVRVVGERVEGIAEKTRPRDITVEFALSFEATGRAQLIPVILTGETKAVTGLKVTAVWGPLPQQG
jgi:hypothetical protein